MARPVLQVLGQLVVAAQPSDPQPQHRFGILVIVPKLLTPLDPLIALLAPRLDRTTCDRQARATITRVIH